MRSLRYTLLLMAVLTTVLTAVSVTLIFLVGDLSPNRLVYSSVVEQVLLAQHGGNP